MSTPLVMEDSGAMLATSRLFPIGAATMTPAMRSAHRYAHSLYACVKPWLQAPILEVGVGFGTYTGFLLQHGPVVACDLDQTCLEQVHRKFPGAALSTVRVDLNDPASIRGLLRHQVRSIFTSNVLEHIADDVAALGALRGSVGPATKLAIIVPAHPRLYGYLDKQAGHFRRYTRRSLADALDCSGWQVERSFYINALGGLGWWLNHRFLPQRPLDSATVNAQLAIYDRVMVPLAQRTDLLFRRFFGLSVVAIASPRDPAARV
ncbi:MAG TPA: class I SAM-dependent methyltransferase [Planctomycetaceae bacterium]|nr:class I SAM-dependent methyltransferase [Planctomycetaceae bacterium]